MLLLGCSSMWRRMAGDGYEQVSTVRSLYTGALLQLNHAVNSTCLRILHCAGVPVVFGVLTTDNLEQVRLAKKSECVQYQLCTTGRGEGDG